MFLAVSRVIEEVRARLGSRTLEFLALEPVPWLLAPYRDGGASWRAALSDDSMCWRRYTIEMAVASHGIELSPTMKAALDSLEEVVTDTPGTLEFLMRENELLFVDNHKTVHSRTPLTNPLTSDRLMNRSWVTPGGATVGTI
jgi:Taurine catabolism dioxygenase TauD, TfdA family